MEKMIVKAFFEICDTHDYFLEMFRTPTRFFIYKKPIYKKPSARFQTFLILKIFLISIFYSLFVATILRFL